MTFVDDGSTTVTQPTAMLASVNDYTDVNTATTTSLVCGSYQD